MSYTYEFPMVSATATVMLFDREILSTSTVMLAKRSEKAAVYPGAWSLPGGFLDAGCETIEETAIRELKEELDFDCSVERLNLFHVSSKPGTDPRAHVINVCFWVDVTKEEQNLLIPGDDISDIKWIPCMDLLTGSTPLAFNHNSIAILGVKNWLLGFK
jgi:8-oxo-dGTP diphosphatase